MTRQLTRQTIGVGVAGTGFIGSAHIEGLCRNLIQVLGLLGKRQRENGTERKMIELYLLLALRRSVELFLGTKNAETAGSKMQNRTREEVILKFQG